MALASIVVVERDPVARERIARQLRELGYAVSESADVTSAPGQQPSPYQEVISASGISIDTVGHRVIVDGDYVNVAPREYRLMLFLLSNQDRVFSRKQLLVHVWDRDASVGSRTIDVHIRRLRSVLEPYGYERYVQTVRGTGYRFSLKP
jgi:two-component system phosphate regulon response regulator PhoB